MAKVRDAAKRPPAPWDSVGMQRGPVMGEGAQGLLDAIALSTMPVPVVGDVAGLASDAYRFATDPESRTWGNAAWASLGMLPFVPFAGMFAGKGAKTADAMKLAEAQKLEQAGADARDIWGKTGWFKGPDGEWRFELTDDYSFLEHPEFAPKGYEKLQHPDVQDAYPDLWNSLQQSITQGPKQRGRLEGGDTIIAQGPTSEGRRSVALHELQHAIQGREGFARGGSASEFESYNKHMRRMLDERVAADRMRRRVAFLDETPIEASEYLAQAYPGIDAETIRRLEQAYPGDELAASISDLERRYKNSDPYQSYLRMAGEAEARAVQSRMNMTAAERAQSFPLDSYDVPLDELIVRKR